MREGVVPQTYWPWKEVGSTRNAKRELSQLMGATAGEDLFITPKPIRLVERMLRIATDGTGEELVLDFFAGSGATGHAVCGGERQRVLVQLPEPIRD